MIRPEKHKNAMRVVHAVLIQARFLAYKKKPWELIASLLDHADHLMNQIRDIADQTDAFAMCVKDISDRTDFQLRGLMEQFEDDG